MVDEYLIPFLSSVSIITLEVKEFSQASGEAFRFQTTIVSLISTKGKTAHEVVRETKTCRECCFPQTIREQNNEKPLTVCT
jgi:hypothetical protein